MSHLQEAKRSSNRYFLTSANFLLLLCSQVELWHSYINWEKGNPLKVEDPALVARRVMFAYEQSLLCLGHHPDIW